MKKLLIGILSTAIVDAYIFDFTLHIFPIANSKMILAVIGVIAFVLKSIASHEASISRRVLISAFLACLFSLWCYIAITLAGSDQMDYVRYFVSFAVWVGGAYGAYSLLSLLHDKVDLMLVTKYLAFACVFQCAIALLIDNVAAVNSLVKAIFQQSYNFYERRGGRLYGIGCALDPAGVRFTAVLVLMSHQLAMEERVRISPGKSAVLFIAFLTITLIGCMISRTTMVGSILGMGYMAVANLRVEQGGIVSRMQIGLSFLLITIVLVAVGISVYLYNTSSIFYSNVRFGFEGFFNWVETGEFSTRSTDHLETMWVWPETRRVWLIGEGRVGVYKTSSDIGYCNFIFYCGLVGMTIYSIYYIFNHLSLISKFRRFTITALLLTAVTFIVWSKVTTDIFFIDALLFCLDGDKDKI